MIGMESHLQMDVVLLLNNLAVRRGLKNNEKESIRSTYGRCGEYGIDYNGYDIDKIENVKHWKDCAFLCNDHIGCSFWILHLDDDNKCILKTSDNGRQHDTHCLSGSYTCLSQC